MWGWPFFTLLSKAPRRLHRYIGGGVFSFHRHLIKVAISFASITCYRLLRWCVLVLFSILSLMAVVVVQSTMNLEKAEDQGSMKIENVLLVSVCVIPTRKVSFIVYGNTKRQRPLP